MKANPHIAPGGKQISNAFQFDLGQICIAQVLMHQQWPTKDLHPLAPVFEIEACVGVHPAKECLSHAARDAVVVRRGVQRDLAISWLGHGS